MINVPEETVSGRSTLERLEAQNEETPNNVMRRFLYGSIVRLINGGPMGAGHRVPLPDCVVEGIRNMLPEADENYMGFKER